MGDYGRGRGLVGLKDQPKTGRLECVRGVLDSLPRTDRGEAEKTE